jgi:transcriptional regulator with XRE-family HTH domain
MTSIHSKEYKELIKRLVKARKEAGLTQKEVAKKLKQHQSYISKIETCQRRVDVLELKKLAKTYKIQISEIL